MTDTELKAKCGVSNAAQRKRVMAAVRRGEAGPADSKKHSKASSSKGAVSYRHLSMTGVCVMHDWHKRHSCFKKSGKNPHSYGLLGGLYSRNALCRCTGAAYMPSGTTPS